MTACRSCCWAGVIGFTPAPAGRAGTLAMMLDVDVEVLDAPSSVLMCFAGGELGGFWEGLRLRSSVVDMCGRVWRVSSRMVGRGGVIGEVHVDRRRDRGARVVCGDLLESGTVVAMMARKMKMNRPAQKSGDFLFSYINIYMPSVLGPEWSFCLAVW